MFLQSCRWSFKLSKGISPMDAFIIFQLSRRARLRRKWFSGENKGRKKQHYKKRKQIRYFIIINTAECWYIIGCTSEGSVRSTDGSLLFMNNLVCLCDVWKGRPYVNAKASLSSIFNIGQSYLNLLLSLSQKSPTQWDSAKCQLLRLYSQFSLPKY